MAIDVAKEVRALEAMTVGELRDRYAEVFGEATRSFNKRFLVKRIAWRLQALEEGGLSERARRRAKELAVEADLRVRPPKPPPEPADGEVVRTGPLSVSSDVRLPSPGVVLTRQYKGKTLHVRILESGFEFEGEVYRSLAAVAKKATGCHWNGFHFFGLQKPVKEATR
jgi:hypothetical protein